jgi:hypothetical protein
MEAAVTGRESQCSSPYATSPKLHDPRLNFRFLKGGSFLYIPAVFRPVSSGSAGITARKDEIDMLGELILNVWGMFVPLILSAVLS